MRLTEVAPPFPVGVSTDKKFNILPGKDSAIDGIFSCQGEQKATPNPLHMQKHDQGCFELFSLKSEPSHEIYKDKYFRMTL